MTPEHIPGRPRTAFLKMLSVAVGHERTGMKIGKIIVWVVGIGAVAYLASWPICGLMLVRSRSRSIQQIRQADHGALLLACRSVMGNAHSFTNDGEVMPWHSDWHATVNRDSQQYSSMIPPAIKDLSPACVRIASNQVYLFWINSPARLCVRAFGPNAKQFGSEMLTNGLWLVTDAKN